MKLYESILSRLQKDIESEATAFAKVMIPAEKTYIDLETRALLPGAAKAKRLAIEKSDLAHKSPDELEKLGAELSALRTIEANPHIQTEAGRKRCADVASLKPTLDALAEAGFASLTRQENELIAEERKFFSTYGVQWSATEVSRSVIPFRQKLAASVNSYDAVFTAINRSVGGQYVGEFQFEPWAFLFATK